MQGSAASRSVRTEKQSDFSQDAGWYNSSVQTQGADTTRNGLVGISGLVVCYYRFELVSLIFHLSSLYDDMFVSWCIHSFLRKGNFSEKSVPRSQIPVVSFTCSRHWQKYVWVHSWIVLVRAFSQSCFLERRFIPKLWYPCFETWFMLD